MREVEVSRLTDVIEKLCIEANEHLPEDVKCAIKTCRACEDGEIAKGILDNIIENFDIADNENVPICQDTGMACVFLEIGQDVHFVGGDLTDAINEGVRRGYTNGYLRKSVVKDPVRRGNTGDNTPAMIYTEIVPGDKVKITVQTERLRKREHEYDPYVQAICRTSGNQRFYPGSSRDCRPEPMSAYGSGGWNRRNL